MLFPVSVTDELAVDLLPLAVSVALSLSVLPLNEYVTVTVHVYFGPRLVPVQVFAVMLNRDDPDSVIFRAAVADLPEFVSVKILFVEPLVSVP
jgi:hypothetical protein